jgi:hypothetical protein
LRFNPLALDIADGIVTNGKVTCAALADALRDRGIAKVTVIEHEDDLPEVALLIDWIWRRLTLASRRLLGVLAHMEGDHMDESSLGVLARVNRGRERALAPLHAFRLVQEPTAGRFTLHAVVRHAVRRRTRADHARLFEHYVSMLERHPERLLLEQTQLFAAMDHAHRTNDLQGMLRVIRLVEHLDSLPDAGLEGGIPETNGFVTP